MAVGNFGARLRTLYVFHQPLAADRGGMVECRVHGYNLIRGSKTT